MELKLLDGKVISVNDNETGFDVAKKISESLKGRKISEETRRKISESNKGKRHSEEVKRKISESQKGKRCGEENPFYGRKHTEEAKRKMSDARKGKNNNHKSKTVEVFKNNLSLGTFPSVREIERKSEELFGTKLFQGAVSAVCRGEKPKYKGFTFRYANK